MSLDEIGGRSLSGGRQFDRDAALLGLLLAVVAFPLRFVVSHLYADVLPLALGVACLLYLLAYRRNAEGYGLPTAPGWLVGLLPSVATLGLAGLVVLVTHQGARTVPFLLLAGGVGSLVLCQVLFVEERELRPFLVLGQILALGTVVRFAALASTTGLLGIDTWTHIQLAEAVRAQGSLAAMLEFPSRAAKYYAAPLYHLLVVVVSVLGGVSLRTALYVGLGGAMALAPLVVYTTARLFVDVRWALVAGLFYAVSDQAVRWSLNLIPTSMALLLFLGALYLLVRILLLRELRDVALLSVLLIALPMTHQVGAFVMLVLLGSAFLVQLVLYGDTLYETPAASDLTGVLTFQLGLIIFVWSLTPYRGGRFLSVIVGQLWGELLTSLGLFALPEQPTAQAASAAAESAADPLDVLIAYVDVFGFVFLLAVAVVGSLYVVERRRASHATLTFVVAIVAMAVFALAFPLMGIGLFLPGRWFGFMYAPMAVVGVVGLGYLASNLDPRLAVVCFLLVVLVFPTTMLVASDATRDNPPFPHKQLRFGYTEAEIDGMQAIGGRVPEGQPVWTDSPYASVFRRNRTHYAVQATVPPNGTVPEDHVVYRRYQTRGAPLFIYNDSVVLRPVPRHRICGDKDILYANGEVAYCVRGS